MVKMRIINEIIIHCSATREGADFCAKDIDKWHKARGWNGIGYHYVVRLDGTIEAGRALSKAGAHCYRHNANSIGVVYIGGLDKNGNPKDTRTEAQRLSLRNLVTALRHAYGLAESKVHGHNEYAAKACPCFVVQTEL